MSNPIQIHPDAAALFEALCRPGPVTWEADLRFIKRASENPKVWRREFASVEAFHYYREVCYQQAIDQGLPDIAAEIRHCIDASPAA